MPFREAKTIKTIKQNKRRRSYSKPFTLIFGGSSLLGTEMQVIFCKAVVPISEKIFHDQCCTGINGKNIYVNIL